MGPFPLMAVGASAITIRMARLGILNIRKQLKIAYERMSPDVK